MHLSIVSPTTPHTGKGQDYRGNWPYLIVKFHPYNGKFDFHIFSDTVDFYIWKLNSCRPIQFVDSILKPIIWYILRIADAFTLTVDTIRRIKFSTWFLEIAGTLVGIWYEKLPQKWGIWQKYRVKSPIIPTHPCTGVVGLTIDRCITLQQQINKTKQQNYIQTFIHTITTKINAVSYNTVQGHPLMLEMVYWRTVIREACSIKLKY